MTQGLINSLTAIISLAIFIVMFVQGYILNKEKFPLSTTITQSILALVALILLFVYIFRSDPSPEESLILFTVTMSASLVRTAKELSGGFLPWWLSLTHSILSVCGFIYVFIFTYSNP